MPNSISETIKARAIAEGFSVVRVADARALPDNAPRLDAFLAAGRHGEMDWMQERTAWRADPQAMWPEARSVIMLGMNYGPDTDPMAVLAQKDRAAVLAAPSSPASLAATTFTPAPAVARPVLPDQETAQRRVQAHSDCVCVGEGPSLSASHLVRCSRTQGV
jgi:hypothetical protein